MIAGIISTRRQAAAEAERRRGEDAEDVSSAHMAEPASEVGLPAPPSSHLGCIDTPDGCSEYHAAAMYTLLSGMLS